MSQAPTNGNSLLDPFGIWKAARDANLEALSKLMIDTVNSDEYSKFTGVALEQILATTQPMRDATEQTMTQTLGMLNLPSRAEVLSLADRLVNVEMLLDDMDAKLSAMQKSIKEAVKSNVPEPVPAENRQLKEIAVQLEELDARFSSMKKIEASLTELSTRLGALQVQAPVAVQPATTPKPEPKTQPKAEARQAPANKAGSTVKEEAK